MKNYEAGLELGRQINRSQCLFHRVFALRLTDSGHLVTIRRCRELSDRERTEIVKAAETHFASIKHFLNARNERSANAVAKLDQTEPERFNLAQHFFGGGMSIGIPGRGKSDHRVSFTRLELAELLLRPPIRRWV